MRTYTVFLHLIARSAASCALRRAALDFGYELLLLHPPVLEPDGYLPLRQVGRGGNLPPLVLGDEFVCSVLFLQFFQLDLGVRYPFLPATTERRAVMLVRHHICLKTNGQRGGQPGVLRTIQLYFHLYFNMGTIAPRCTEWLKSAGERLHVWSGFCYTDRQHGGCPQCESSTAIPPKTQVHLRLLSANLHIWLCCS